MSFQPDAPPAGLDPIWAEWITRQLRRVSEFSTQTVQVGSNHDGRIATLEQHPPRTDNPHGTSWTNLLGKPSCVVNWRGEWASGSYNACDMIRDGRYAMIANKVTEDRPAPQPSGAPFWVSDLPGTPAWGLQSATSSSLVVGQRYSWDTDGYLKTIRYDRAVATPDVDHQLWVVLDPLGTPDSQKIAGPIVPDATGWFEFPQGQIFIIAGQVFDVFLLTRAVATPTPWNAEYDYKRQNGDPDEKEIAHQSAGGGNQMRVHYLDEQLTDREPQLTAMQVGDEISGGGINWTITSTDPRIEHIRFGVTPATRASEGKYIFTFTSYAPAPIAYNRADNHFLAEPRVQGFYSETGYQNIVLDNHAYGVDIEIQQAIISPDWDLVAFSG